MNNIIKNKWMQCTLTLIIGFAASFLGVFLLQYFHFQLDFEKTIEFISNQTRLNFMEAGIVFLVFLWSYFLSGSRWLSSFMIILFSFILGIASQQKLLYRGEPLYPSDAYFLKDFRFLLTMVDAGILTAMATILVLLTAAIVYFVKKRKKEKISKNWFIVRMAGFVIISFALFYVYQFNQPGNKIKAAFTNRVSWISYSQERNYTENGVVSGLMYNFKAPAVDKPENYSKATIQAVYEKYNQEAEKINQERNNSLEDVNIIYVMSETFSDLQKIEGLTISKDSIPKFRELTKNSLSGEVLSQGYGGGTANIEFEALTGISLEPLSSNITTPFIQLSNQMSKLPSVMDYMAETNHQLTAIHPYNTTMYKRLENYQALGFDSYIFQDDMKYTERIDENTYISDEAAHMEVMDVLKESDGKDFVHLVTMQNHKPFVHKYEEVEYEVEGAPYNLEVANYAQGLQYSDDALQTFLDELDEFNEKTIVVFWGDHLPSFYGDELFNLNGHVTMHETPLLFYSNFTENVEDLGTISPIYFINHLLEMTNTPVKPFSALLHNMEAVLPAMEKGFYLERGSELKNDREELNSETQEILEDYDMILYDLTTGKNYSKELGFY
ncbi:sulfatase-like hydrolase/transferase [Jeotgalibaca sp. MA1X17-3]|uniref:LTA synthase family protein n=1 Tax=Jeotgalibaca sp. MA1X17-3 TaxID=2908211 RepID=UPI001F2763DC|nr:alkaline phosphatase family protein [Jeotgalibaca sp. MA1X17-3]UJF15234.1 sulfatase-like hydrolase/transferase [Jeotgalibaca sp. MA1X17-3]